MGVGQGQGKQLLNPHVGQRVFVPAGLVHHPPAMSAMLPEAMGFQWHRVAQNAQELKDLPKETQLGHVKSCPELTQQPCVFFSLESHGV